MSMWLRKMFMIFDHCNLHFWKNIECLNCFGIITLLYQYLGWINSKRGGEGKGNSEVLKIEMFVVLLRVFWRATEIGL